MAVRIQYEASSIRNCAKQVMSAAGECATAAKQMGSAMYSKGWQCSERALLCEKIDGLQDILRMLSGKMDGFSAICGQSADIFEATENQFAGQERALAPEKPFMQRLFDGFCNFVSESVRRISAVVSSLWQTLAGKPFLWPFVVVNPFTALAAGILASTLTGKGKNPKPQAPAPAAPQAETPWQVHPKTYVATDANGNKTVYPYSDERGYMPDWVVQKQYGGTQASCQGTYPGQVSMYNDDAQTKISCTYHTLNRLRQNGRELPCGPGNSLSGKYWFGRATGVPKFEGSNPLGQIVAEFGQPVKNIVVSTGSSSYPTHGHVLLIDRIEDGQVFFTEHTSGQQVHQLSIADFEQQYNGRAYNEGIIGAAVIG